MCTQRAYDDEIYDILPALEWIYSSCTYNIIYCSTECSTCIQIKLVYLRTAIRISENIVDTTIVRVSGGSIYKKDKEPAPHFTNLYV